jgi:MFS family permease
MFAMMYTYEHMNNMPFGLTPSTSVWLTCLLYVFRTIFMNCTSGLTKGVLMDSVPREERGKWSALESFNTASWSGSSFIGGILVGVYGISVNFYVTSIMQLVATIPLMLLFNRVSHREQAKATTS